MQLVRKVPPLLPTSATGKGGHSLTGMCSLRFQSAHRSNRTQMSGCGRAMRAAGAESEGAVGAPRPVLTASHDVMALRLETLGQVATTEREREAVA